MIKLVQAIFVAFQLMGAHLAVADENRKLPTIGLAIPVDPASDAPLQKAFRDGLRDLGYVDGTNVTLIVRYSNGDPVKYREIIRELIALPVDVLWGQSRELKEATATIPIVSATMADPVTAGLVTSLARPGGNLTGISWQTYDIAPKQLELAKELLPSLKRLCLLLETDYDPGLAKYIENELRARARDIGVSMCVIRVRTLNEVRSMSATIDKERPQAIVTWSSPFLYQHRDALMASVAHRVPILGDGRQLVDLGAVLTYSVDWPDMFRRSAVYVAKILKGAKPGDLPIEQPTKFNLVVNLKAAKALRITVPESILVRANEIVR